MARHAEWVAHGSGRRAGVVVAGRRSRAPTAWCALIGVLLLGSLAGGTVPVAGGAVLVADGTPGPPPDAPPDPAAVGAAPGAGYRWPLVPAPAVDRRFEEPAHTYGPGHRGVDLAGAPGQQVVAARAGTVVFAGPVAGRGVVSVQHDDGLRSTYEPLSPTVDAGAAVRAGDVLGLLQPGHRGCASSACLHWGVRRDRTVYVDPLVLLRPPQVRLLPVPDPWPGGSPPRAAGAGATLRVPQPAAGSSSLPRSRPMSRECSRHTRDSVTPSCRPISASVRFST